MEDNSSSKKPKNPNLKIAKRINRLIVERNNELKRDAIIAGVLGLLFCILIFGAVWGLAFLLLLNSLSSWSLLGSFLIAFLFLLVAFYSVWRQENPFANLKPMTDAQALLTKISLVSDNVFYVSPRHSIAGFAGLLLGGPANICKAVEIWLHQLDDEKSLSMKAAKILVQCKKSLECEKISHPQAALILRRLALVKVLETGKTPAFTVTEKGSMLLE